LKRRAFRQAAICAQRTSHGHARIRHEDCSGAQRYSLIAVERVLCAVRHQRIVFPDGVFRSLVDIRRQGSGHPDRFLCVLAEVWQPQWLRNLCTDPTYFLFPGQFAPMQQKTFGAILVLVGIIDLEAARAFSIETLADRPLQIVVPGLSGALADPVRTCGPLYFCG
jgi:hypothetical protein